MRSQYGHRCKCDLSGADVVAIRKVCTVNMLQVITCSQNLISTTKCGQVLLMWLLISPAAWSSLHMLIVTWSFIYHAGGLITKYSPMIMNKQTWYFITWWFLRYFIAKSLSHGPCDLVCPFSYACAQLVMVAWSAPWLTIIIHNDHNRSVNGQQDSVLHGIPEQQNKVFHTLQSNDIIDNFSSETGPVAQWLQRNSSP